MNGRLTSLVILLSLLHSPFQACERAVQVVVTVDEVFAIFQVCRCFLIAAQIPAVSSSASLLADIPSPQILRGKREKRKEKKLLSVVY